MLPEPEGLWAIPTLHHEFLEGRRVPCTIPRADPPEQPVSSSTALWFVAYGLGLDIAASMT